MIYLRNCWYVAAWSHEVGREPLGRTLLGEPVVFYRRADGSAVAMAAPCPHRFAPLHGGDLVGDNIRCPYHGLQFGPDGRCVHSPHVADGTAPAMAVRTYPVEDRNSMLWIWMGDEAAVTPNLAAEVYAPLNDPGTMHGYLHLNCDYRLVVDNLIDHAHTTHLHRDSLASDALTLAKTQVRRVGDVIHAERWAPNGKPSATFGEMAGTGDELVDRWLDISWRAPTLIHTQGGVTKPGRPREEGVVTHAAHIATPETETSAHYFWGFSRNVRQDDVAYGEKLRAAIDKIFRTEDKPMLEGQQAMMRGEDFWALRPVLMDGDQAAAMIRKLLAQMIADEAAVRERTPASEPSH